MGESDSPILEDFLAPVREAGGGVHLKNLYNDYVYFWRWALWKVFESTEGGGIVTFITASSYLKGPAFAGMRRKMREVFDELWIVDLEGDNLGARKTENVFAIQTPVAIAIGVRNGNPKPLQPARVRKVRFTGSAQEKLAQLDGIQAFSDLSWQECTAEWGAPFYARGTGGYFDWPKVTDVFPWQHSGVQLKRTWPIGVTQRVLADRWRAFLAAPPDLRPSLFRRPETALSRIGTHGWMAQARILRLLPWSPMLLIPRWLRTHSAHSTVNVSLWMQGWAISIAQPCIARMVPNRLIW